MIKFLKMYMKKYFIFIPILLIIIAIPVTLILINKNKGEKENTESTQQEQEEKNNDPEGTIYVEAGAGTLSTSDSFSYIKESARGLEAYLAGKGASAIYDVVSEESGKYTLYVKLTDDGLYTPGTRDVTIIINNFKTLAYKHTPEDTKGWKWYEIGETPINRGSNTIVFTKNEDTAGAYVMDEFKLIPVK